MMRKDMEAKGLREEDATNRNRWKQMTRAADPAIPWDLVERGRRIFREG